jgi:REP element-mobilizing transposase RayT
MNADNYHKPPKRKSIRLHGYDYSQPGGYFITVCINDRTQRLFGDVQNGAMALNEMGEYVRQYWLDIPNHFPNTKLDEYVIMPNHVHGIITIIDPGGITPPLQQKCKTEIQYGRDDRAPTEKPTKKPTVGMMMAYFKYQSTTRINAKPPGIIQKIWQRGYFDHIVRNRKSLFFIRKYIQNNPINWERDKDNAHSQEEIDEVIDQNTQ